MSFKNFQKLLFYLLLFLIPSNLGKHFILSSSYVSGILVDYLIPTLYLTDIMILILLASWLWKSGISNIKNQILKISFGKLRIPSEVEGQIKYQKSKKPWVAFIILYLLLNAFLAPNKPAAFYKFCKLSELFLLSIYIKSNINIKKDIKKIAQVCAGSSIFQSLLALAQWTKDGSVFNNYLFFGEQPYSLSTPGIKKISFQGLIKAPPLGTFPHPNVLAGFLVLTFPIIFSFRPKKPFLKIFFTIYYLLSAICLFLTFSFPAWLALGIILAFKMLKQACPGDKARVQHDKKKFLLFTVYGLLIAALALFYQNFSTPLSFSRRQTLNLIALKMFLKNPLTGVGLNNFTYVMENYGQVIGFTRFLQPVHSVYLLILSETGIIGFLIFLYLILKILRNVLKTKKFILHTSYFILLFLLFFDHYLFTTQQGLLFSFVIFGFF